MTCVLAIDVGNTALALAVWQGERALRHWRLASSSRTADELGVLVGHLLAQSALEPEVVTGCVLGSVVPALTDTVAEACAQLFGARPMIVGPGTATGLRIRAADPHEVGADRIANAIAARERWGQPVIVLDFGTALTVDVVDSQGDYVGALIAPGMAVAADALARRTAQLTRPSLVAPPAAIANNTEQGLQSGLVIGFAGMVDGLVERVREHVGPAPVIATGDASWAQAVLAQTSVVQAVEPLLTLDGLRRIYERELGRG